ncbi:hypothetical protein L6Q79_05330 [bacterium]|nr:hypothetical protein [bacterium]
MSEIRKSWSKIVVEVNREKRRVGSVLELAWPYELQSDLLKLGFTTSGVTPFQVEMVQKEREFVAGVIAQFTTKRVRLVLEPEKIIRPVERVAYQDEPVPEPSPAENFFDHYPTLDAAHEAFAETDVKPDGNEAQISVQVRSDLFKYVRDKEAEMPLKRMIELLDCELIDITNKDTLTTS